jgi:hypothetical protein
LGTIGGLEHGSLDVVLEEEGLLGLRVRLWLYVYTQIIIYK